MTQEEVGMCLSLKAAKRCALCKGLTSGTSHISDSGCSPTGVYLHPSSSQPQAGNKTQDHYPGQEQCIGWALGLHRFLYWGQIWIEAGWMPATAWRNLNTYSVKLQLLTPLWPCLLETLYRHTPPQPSSHQGLKSIHGDG